MTCFSWLLTMLACGWVDESVCRHAFIVRLLLTSATVVVSSCSLVFHGCCERPSKPRLSRPRLSQYVVSFSLGSFLGRVAVVAQRLIVIKLFRGRSVGLPVHRSVQCIVKKRRIGSGCRLATYVRCAQGWARSGVWGSVHGKGYFWGAPL